MDIAVKKFFNGTEPHQIYTYEEFMNASVEKFENTKENELSEQELIRYNHIKINLHRIKRIIKTHKPNVELMDLVLKIKTKQIWLIITEDWCGDSAQNLPYLYEYVKKNPLISILVVLRDTNLQTIDNYFSEGNPRSIPKIVVFNENGDELYTWGPRPKFAQDLVQQLKSEGYTKEQFNKELHLWYGRNRGSELIKEFTTVLQKNS